MKNEQDIVVIGKGGLKTKFETKYHSFSFCVLYIVHLWLFFCASNDIKNVQFGVEMRENLKMFGDSIPFAIYPSCNRYA
jgi:hypothetical protein